MLASCATAAFAQEAVQEAIDVGPELQACFACHGPNGASTQPRYPVLAGQEEYYLYVQLRDFQAGRRENAEMAPLVANLSREQMKAMARFFSQQTWPRQPLEVDEATVRSATTAATAGQCSQCHLGGYGGNSRIPRLAGQHPEYLQQTMLDLKTRARKNSADMSALMELFSDEEIAAMARYAASLTIHGRAETSEVD